MKLLRCTAGVPTRHALRAWHALCTGGDYSVQCLGSTKAFLQKPVQEGFHDWENDTVMLCHVCVGVLVGISSIHIKLFVDLTSGQARLVIHNEVANDDIRNHARGLLSGW